MKILVLGASYGSLLSTKLLMAGHDVTLVCTADEALLINAKGTIVRLTLRDEKEPRLILSGDLRGHLDAVTPAKAVPADYNLVALAMQEPQYDAPEIGDLLSRIASAGKPAMSIMNMPPLPYLRRIPGIDARTIREAYADPSVWDVLNPALVTLCSPDPQAFRSPEEGLNFLHVGLPTNFKVAAFDSPVHTDLLKTLERDIAAVRLDGKEVPVKLKLNESLFVPLAKWPMLLTGNYRAITRSGVRPIEAAVHEDLSLSREVYNWVADLTIALGGSQEDAVPFEKYARAAEGLLKPSSAARAIAAGATRIERVDLLVQKLAASRGLWHPEVDQIVSIVDARLAANRRLAS